MTGMLEVDSSTNVEIDEEIEALKARRREFIRKIWDIESDIIFLKETKTKRAEALRRLGDVEPT